MQIRNLIHQALAARRETGKRVSGQLMDLLRLQRGPGRLGPSEYYQYGLHDDDRFDFGAKRAFVGWRGERDIHARFNNKGWQVLSLDKTVFLSLLRAAGLPHPPVQALYDPAGRFLEQVPTLTTPESLARYLLEEATFPLFVKPSHGQYGKGAHLLRQANRASGRVVTQNGEVDAETFARSLETRHANGQLIQQAIPAHPDLVPVCGDRASTVRVVSIMAPQGVVPCSAVWKIPTGRNIIDNFQHGRSGNLLGAVDLERGSIVRVIGPTAQARLAEQSRHPDTGARLQGVTLPYWGEILALARQAGSLMPRIRIQHLDIALNPDGPGLLEINSPGNFDLHQHASGRGFLSTRVATALAECERSEEEERRTVLALPPTGPSGA